MKYSVVVFSIFLVLSQEVSADSDSFLGGIVGAVVGSVLSDNLKQQSSNRNNIARQQADARQRANVAAAARQRANAAAAARQRANAANVARQKAAWMQSIARPSKPVKKRAPKDESSIAIVFRNQSKQKQYQLQARLRDMGMYTSTVDGVWGRNTRNAIKAYAEKNAQGHMLNTFSGAETLVNSILKDNAKNVVNVVIANSTNKHIKDTKSIKDSGLIKSQYDDIQKQLKLLTAIIRDQKTRPENDFRKSKISAIEDLIAKYQSEQEVLETSYQRKYETPIRPENKNLGITATKASEIFPKIPYYIPGTKEIGDMWVEPKVSDKGQLYYGFTFMDPSSDYAKVRESVELKTKEVELMINGFEKVNDWTKVAQKQNIRKRYSKQATCFPSEDCLEKKVGNTSTEVIFLIYENGSTATKIQRNKGNFSSDYNFSIESSMMLAAYLEFVKGVGQKEFDTGKMTEKELGTLFQ